MFSSEKKRNFFFPSMFLFPFDPRTLATNGEDMTLSFHFFFAAAAAVQFTTAKTATTTTTSAFVSLHYLDNDRMFWNFLFNLKLFLIWSHETLNKCNNALNQWFSIFGSWRPTKQKKAQLGDPFSAKSLLKYRFWRPKGKCPRPKNGSRPACWDTLL